MGFFTDLIRSVGWIYGSLMLLAGFAAMCCCGWAAIRQSRRAARRAVYWSVAPFVIGFMGAVHTGAYVAQTSGPGALAWPLTLKHLGYVILFGVLESLAPLAVAVVLARRASRIPAEPPSPVETDFDDRATTASEPTADPRPKAGSV